MRTKIAPTGYVLQLYRGSSGFNFDRLAANLPRYKACGVTGIAPHGFVGDLDRTKFDKYVKLAKANGLACYAAYGLGSKDPVQRGTWIGKVAQHPDCSGILFDMEGGFEDENSDKQAATDLGKAFVAQFPNGERDVWCCDQPWAVPSYHWSKFPWEEAAAFVDARAAQFYYNDWKGVGRYDRLNPWFHTDWDKLNARLARTNNVRPLLLTLQAYGWSDIFPKFISCLLDNPTAFFWCDQGLPRENALLGMRTVKALAESPLRAGGFRGASAVLDFQKAYNATNPAKRIAEDGKCGYRETLPALGIVPTDAEMSEHP